ncbi:hypothetical protein HK105_203643 [Polyrhizophydium stewartii]|uniref:Uncharacterized protein n=1 Tax=Polyrhizophydium stewartii TaxID=2732419 RepID=A0ABR4NBQ1_9FUNG
MAMQAGAVAGFGVFMAGFCISASTTSFEAIDPSLTICMACSICSHSAHASIAARSWLSELPEPRWMCVFEAALVVVVPFFAGGAVFSGITTAISSPDILGSAPLSLLVSGAAVATASLACFAFVRATRGARVSPCSGGDAHQNKPYRWMLLILWSTEWSGDARLWDFERHFTQHPSSSAKRALVSFLWGTAWFSLAITLFGIGLRHDPGSGVAVSFAVALAVSLAGMHGFVQMRWLIFGALLVVGSAAALLLSGAVVVEMIGSGRFASLAVAAGAIFGAFSLACLTTVLVTRTTHFGNSRIWILAALVVSAIGWIVVVAGVAMSGGKPGLAAAPVVQYLQITVPGGLSCVAMLFVHFYGRCFSKQGRSEKRLEAPKTASKPSRFEFLKRWTSRLTNGSSESGSVEQGSNLAPPIVVVHEPELQEAGNNGIPATQTAEPASVGLDTQISPTAEAGQEVGDELTSERARSEGTQMHSYVVLACQVTAVMAGTTIVSGPADPLRTSSVITIVGSVLSIVGCCVYVAHVYCIHMHGASEGDAQSDDTPRVATESPTKPESKETHIGGELHVDATSEAKESNATEVDDDAKTETKSEAGLSTSSVLPSTVSLSDTTSKATSPPKPQPPTRKHSDNESSDTSVLQKRADALTLEPLQVESLALSPATVAAAVLSVATLQSMAAKSITDSPGMAKDGRTDPTDRTVDQASPDFSPSTAIATDEGLTRSSDSTEPPHHMAAGLQPQPDARRPWQQSDESEQGDAESLLGPHKASRYLKRDEAALSLDDIDE